MTHGSAGMASNLCVVHDYMRFVTNPESPEAPVCVSAQISKEDEIQRVPLASVSMKSFLCEAPGGVCVRGRSIPGPAEGSPRQGEPFLN